MTETTRRGLVRDAVKVGTATVVAPGFVSVAAGDTSSGEVELTTRASIPTAGEVTITVFEDTDGDGTVDNEQTVTISENAQVYQLDTLTATNSDPATFWLEIDMSTSDNSVTPELHSAAITIPGENQTAPTEPDPYDPPEESRRGIVGSLWKDYKSFIALVTLAVAAIGTWSRSLAVGAWAGYIAFVFLAITGGDGIFQDIAVVTLVLTFLGMAFKLISMEFGGDS